MSELNFTHSNGNKVKLTTPDTLAANRTFKLPGADGTAGQVLMTDGNGNLSFVDPPYSVYDKWVGASTTTGRQNPYTNWVRHSYTGVHIATGMSHSSGIFTFPKTGIYLVRFNADAYNTSNYERTVDCAIEYTTNDSSYSTLQNGSGNIHNIGSYNIHSTITVQAMFDVVNVSTHKVKFSVKAYNNESSLKLQSYSASGGFTYCDFTRVADT